MGDAGVVFVLLGIVFILMGIMAALHEIADQIKNAAGHLEELATQTHEVARIIFEDGEACEEPEDYVGNLDEDGPCTPTA